MSDIKLIKLFMSNKETYEKYSPYLRKEALAKETQVILNDIRDFYAQFQDDKDIKLEVFTTWFFQVRHPELNQIQVELYKQLWSNVDDTVIEEDDKYIQNLISHFKDEAIKAKLTDYIESSQELSSDAINEILENKQADYSEVEYDIYDIDRIDDETDRSNGLRWRLHFLNKHIGPVMKGDAIFIGAYVNTGKSAFCYSEAAYMAQQLTEGTVLIFNNEQKNNKVQKRLTSAVVEQPWDDVIKVNKADWFKEYKARLNGDEQRIRTFWAMNWTPEKIGVLAKKYNAKLIIVDMMSKLKITGKAADIESLRVGKIAAELRQIANNICPVIATVQCDSSVTWQSEGQVFFQHYIGMHQLRQSKVDLQGDAEFILTIGKDDKHPNTRYLNLVKSKEGMEEQKTEVIFDGYRSIYEDYKF